MESNKYQNGKIYALKSKECEKYYIGSTIQSLKDRLCDNKKKHRLQPNYISSYEILKYDDCYIELIELFPCNNKQELQEREGEIQRERCREIVNKRQEGRTKKQWAIDNIEHVREKRKEKY